MRVKTEGRTQELTKAVQAAVDKRAGHNCERCGKPAPPGRRDYYAVRYGAPKGSLPAAEVRKVCYEPQTGHGCAKTLLADVPAAIAAGWLIPPTPQTPAPGPVNKKHNTTTQRR